MNKEELLAEIATEVVSVGDIQHKPGDDDAIANIRTYDVTVYNTINSNNDLQKSTQVIYVKDESSETETAYRGRTHVTNYTEPVNDEAVLLARFTEIENLEGGEIKVDPVHLNELGIKYFVFESNGIRKVTATLNGVSITRVVA